MRALLLLSIVLGCALGAHSARVSVKDTPASLSPPALPLNSGAAQVPAPEEKEALKAKAKAKRETFDQLLKNLNEAIAQMHKREAEAMDSKNEVETLRVRVEQLKKQAKDLYNEMIKATKEAVAAGGNVSLEERKEMEQAAVGLNTIESLIAQAKDAASGVKEVKDKIASRTVDMSKLKQEIDAADKIIEQQKKNKELATTQYSAVTAALAEAQKALADLEAKKASAIAAAEAQRQEVQRHQKKAQELADQHAKAQKEIAKEFSQKIEQIAGDRRPDNEYVPLNQQVAAEALAQSQKQQDPPQPQAQTPAAAQQPAAPQPATQSQPQPTK